MRVAGARTSPIPRPGPKSSRTSEVAELDAAIAHARKVSEDFLDIGKADFPLPTLGAAPQADRGRADGRPRLRALARPAARALVERRDVPGLLGDRRPPRPALAAEPLRSSARRRHRPGQDAGRSHGARQRTRPDRPGVPLRRLGPRRPDVPGERRQRRRLGGLQLRRPAQRPGARAAGPGRGALQAPALRHARRAGARRRRAGTRCRCSPSAAGGSSCA